jgi:hypothetical protein
MSDETFPGYNRVSEYCSIWEDFSQIDPEFLQHRADIGTHVHTAIRHHLCDIPINLSQEEQPYFDSWLLWYQSVECSISHEETRLFDGHLELTGAIDGIITPRGCASMIVDWKTSSCEHPLIWPLKGAFYHHLVEWNELCEICNEVLFVKLMRNGKKAKPFSYVIDAKLKNMIHTTIDAYNFKKEVEKYEQKFKR